MYYVGIDVGGTNLKAGVVDEQGKIISKVDCPTQVERGHEAVVESMARLALQAVEKAGELPFVEGEAGGEGRVEPLRGGGGEILAVRGENLPRMVAEAGRHGGEGGVADLGGGPGERPGGGARGAGEFVDVHGALG